MKHRTLDQLAVGDHAVVASVADTEAGGRLVELGIFEGTRVEVLHEAPFSRDPIAIRARGTIVALRRSEAASVVLREGA